MSDRGQLFVAPPFENHSPLTWYQAAAEQLNFIRDEAQARAIEYLDRRGSQRCNASATAV